MEDPDLRKKPDTETKRLDPQENQSQDKALNIINPI